jgi:tetratricopeptide (TPR) repeat protein
VSFKTGRFRSVLDCRCLIVVLFVSYFLLSVGCALPRIIVLEDPLSPEEHLNLGVAYEKKGEWNSAIAQYRAASGELPIANTYIGNVYFQMGDSENAEIFYRRAIKKVPGNGDAYNNLAWLYYTKRENLDEAESLAMKALEVNPSGGDLYRDTLGKIRALKNGSAK